MEVYQRMSLELYSEQRRSGRPTWPATAFSAAVHLAAVLLILQPFSPDIPKKSKSEYQQAIAGKEKQIVWYRFKKDLPDVSPAPKSAKTLALKAAVKAKQAMISAPKNAPKRQQMVWSPAPPVVHLLETQSANVLAIKMPEPAPPPPPPGKPFIAPPDIAKTASVIAPPTMEEAPSIRPFDVKPLALQELPKVAKRFTPPPSTRAQVTPRRVPVKLEPLPEAGPPDLSASFDSTLLEVFHVPLPAPKRPFRSPPTTAASAASAPARRVRVEAVPSAGTAGAGVRNGTSALSYNSLSTRVAPPAPEAAKGNSKDLNMAAVGLNPTENAAVPSASSPGEFSAGPVIRKEGASSAGEGKGLTVPDLFVRGAKDAKPDLIARAYAPATSSDNIRESMRHANPSFTNSAPTVPMKMNGAIQVSNAPDPRFQGRDVFMMAIQMPNITSYSGSWLMWYAERTAQQKGLGAIAPPMAFRKVDPKYIATAVEERVEGRVQLACVIKSDGTVAGVQIVRGLDDRLNRSAEEALAKWEFTPAKRNGEPVDVDVLVEIPFHLAPKIKGPR